MLCNYEPHNIAIKEEKKDISNCRIVFTSPTVPRICSSFISSFNLIIHQ